MLKPKKKIASILAFISIISIFSGCSTNYNDTSKPDNSQNLEIDEPVPSEDDTKPDDGDLQVGDTVDIEKILNYISSGGEYVRVYAVKRGDEYQIANCYDGRTGDWRDAQYENGALVLIPETTIIEISASQNDELVYFGHGSSWLNGVSEYHYAAPFPISKPTSYGEEISGELQASYSFGDAGYYIKNKIEGPRDLEVLSKWTITEINGISAEDVTVQENLVAIGDYNDIYLLLNDEETIILGGYENTSFEEAEVRCGYMLRVGEQFRLKGTRTKEGYTIIANGKELKELGDYTTFQLFIYGIVQVVD